ncbi:MAG: thermonuclease family protein [Candidatus Pacearchaeota archaeon]|jgi:micrococcal nuclease
MEKKNQIYFLVLLILILFTINYPYLNSMVERSLSGDRVVNVTRVIVTRVIDGDTIEIETGEHIRLLGINTPEKGEEYSNEAKEFLEGEILGREVELVFGRDKYDKYKRILAYVYLGNENVNQEIVEAGFANYYFPSGKDNYYEDFRSAWKNCLNKKINLCEKSEDICADCIELKKFDYKSEILVFYNKCSFDCDLTNWGIKDEGRKHFSFEDFILEAGKKVEVKVGEGGNTQSEIFWGREDYVWTDSGDTMFLRDDKNKLVLWKSY